MFFSAIFCWHHDIGRACGPVPCWDSTCRTFRTSPSLCKRHASKAWMWVMSVAQRSGVQNPSHDAILEVTWRPWRILWPPRAPTSMRRMPRALAAWAMPLGPIAPMWWRNCWRTRRDGMGWGSGGLGWDWGWVGYDEWSDMIWWGIGLGGREMEGQRWPKQPLLFRALPKDPRLHLWRWVGKWWVWSLAWRPHRNAQLVCGFEMFRIYFILMFPPGSPLITSGNLTELWYWPVRKRLNYQREYFSAH